MANSFLPDSLARLRTTSDALSNSICSICAKFAATCAYCTVEFFVQNFPLVVTQHIYAALPDLSEDAAIAQPCASYWQQPLMDVQR